MSIVPQDVFDLYDEFTDHFLDDFGTDCLLVYSKIESITNSLPDIKQRKTLNLQNSNDGIKRADDSFRTVEITESIRLRLYWQQEDFRRVGNIILPEGSVVAYGKKEDLNKVERASNLIIYVGTKPHHQEWRFEKFTETIIAGLTDKEFISFWKRI